MGTGRNNMAKTCVICGRPLSQEDIEEDSPYCLDCFVEVEEEEDDELGDDYGSEDIEDFDEEDE
jgi:hypothetical protein